MTSGHQINTWLKGNNIEDVEAFVPDMAGFVRGKVLPADKFVNLYAEVKKTECNEFQEIVTPLGAGSPNVQCLIEIRMWIRDDLSIRVS